MPEVRLVSSMEGPDDAPVLILANPIGATRAIWDAQARILRVGRDGRCRLLGGRWLRSFLRDCRRGDRAQQHAEHQLASGLN